MELTGDTRAMCVFAHPDDEVLGCGGVLAYMADYAIPVTFVWLAYNPAMEAECANALSLLGFRDCNLVRYQFMDNMLDRVPQSELNRAVEDALKQHPSNLIFTHHHNDLNVDHRMTNEAVIVATRPIMGQKDISVICCEVLSSSGYRKPWGFDFNLYHGMTKSDLRRKKDAMHAYESQDRMSPHPRSGRVIEARAVYHGSMINRDYAEAYYLYRGMLG